MEQFLNNNNRKEAFRKSREILEFFEKFVLEHENSELMEIFKIYFLTRDGINQLKEIISFVQNHLIYLKEGLSSFTEDSIYDVIYFLDENYVSINLYHELRITFNLFTLPNKMKIQENINVINNYLFIHLYYYFNNNNN
jgi:hypothetical protein